VKPPFAPSELDVTDTSRSAAALRRSRSARSARALLQARTQTGSIQLPLDARVSRLIRRHIVQEMQKAVGNCTLRGGSLRQAEKEIAFCGVFQQNPN